MIKLHDLYFKPFISEDEIQEAVQRMVDAVVADLADEIPVFVGILNGSFMLASDFVKLYPKPCEVTFIKLASYEGVKSTEDIQRLIGLTQDLTGRTVVILEDIIDSGNTLAEVHRIFRNENVKQLLIATLFYKPEAYKKDFKLHYVGMEIPNKFIVGYGLDYNGLGRDMPAVYQLKSTQHMTNFVLFGPPGAGKSTTCDQLARSFEQGFHLHCDDIYNMVKGGYKAPWDDTDDQLKNLMIDSCVDIIRNYSEAGFEVVVDYVFSISQLERLVNGISENFVLTVLCPSINVNIERDKSRKWIIGGERVRLYNGLFADSKEWGPFLLDTSNLSVDEVLSLIQSKKKMTQDEL